SDDDPGGRTPTRVYRLPQGASRGQSLAQRRGRRAPAFGGARFRRGQPARRVVVEQILLDTPKPLPHFGLGQVRILQGLGLVLGELAQEVSLQGGVIPFRVKR